MTVDVTTEIVIDRPVESVVEIAGDPTNAPKWYENIESVTWKTEPPPQIGSLVTFVAKFLGRRLEYTYEVVELDDSHLVMRTAEGPFPMETTYTFTPISPTSTRIALRNRGEPSGFSKLAAPLMVTAMRRANQKDLAKLKALVERGGAVMLAIRARHAFDGEQLLSGGAFVLVDGGRILGVEPLGFTPPDGCEVIDSDGTVLPGLVNAHVHLCGDSRDGALERLPEFTPDHLEEVIATALHDQLASGVTTVRDLGDPHWSVVDRRDAARVGEPHIVASGPPITSVGGHCWMMGGEAAGVDALRAAVRERAERRVDVVKIMASGGNMTPGTDIAACQFTLEELRAVVDESHLLGLRVTAHAHALLAVEQAIDAGVDGIEHCTCFTDAGMDFSPDLMARLSHAQIAVCPTLGRDPGVDPPPRIREMLERFNMTFETRNAIVAAAHAAGVRIISGDDGGITNAKRHGIFAEALIALHSGGVSVADSLVSGTSLAAQGCGVADRKGTLRAGYDADVLVVDGDATTDITALRSVSAVFLRGQRAALA